MTPEEQEMLRGLVERVQQTRLTEKDPDAQQLIDQGLARNPDALYIMAQTILVQGMALEQAQAQVRQLQQRLQAPVARASSFLGNLLGHHDPPPAPPQYQSYPPQGAPPPYGNPGYSYGPPSPGYIPGYPPMSAGGGFLRSAATTAAGVAAGALAFEGIESLMHGGYGGGGFGGYGNGMGMGARPEETVINNYYDEPRGGESHHEEPASFDNPRDGSGLQNADYETHGQDDLQQGSDGSDSSGADSDPDDSASSDPGDSGDSGDSYGGDDSGSV